MTSSQSRKDRAREEKLQRKAALEIPVLEFDFGAPGLSFHGPIISTTLTISEQHKEALARGGLPIPAPVTCRFLIDTGADVSVVKHEFAQQAGLKLINPNTPLHGVGIDTTGKMFMGRIVFGCNSQAVPGIMHRFALDVQIQSAKLETDRIDGLIGRNVLHDFEMIYNGLTGKVTMRFIGKSTAKRLPHGTPL